MKVNDEYKIVFELRDMALLIFALSCILASTYYMAMMPDFESDFVVGTLGVLVFWTGMLVWGIYFAYYGYYVREREFRDMMKRVRERQVNQGLSKMSAMMKKFVASCDEIAAGKGYVKIKNRGNRRVPVSHS
jgi:hypothetical protein